MAGAAETATAAAASCSSPWPEMLAGVVLESRRVVAAHSRHFLSLSVLFLLPLSSLLVAAPPLLVAAPPLLSSASGRRPSTNSFLLLHRGPSAAASAALAALYAAAVVVLLLAAFAAISNSVLRGFYGRPVKILDALRSILPPLGRLLLTLALALLLPSLLLASLFKVLSLLHIPIPVVVALAAAAAAAIGLLWLQLNWTLCGVIAVLEPSWGFATLWRSADLMKGMRWASLLLSLFFSAGVGLTLWGLSLGCEEAHAAGRDWSRALPVVAKTVVGSAITAVLLLYWMVTTVVLYLYCKALHGELASEIAEEFAWEYVCLPFDENRAPHVVSVIRQ